MNTRVSFAGISTMFRCALILLCSSLLFPCVAEGASYTLGVPTQMSPVEMHRRWSPFAEWLSRELGITVQLKVYDTISQYETDVMKGGPDFAFMNPYLVVATQRTQRYIPLLRDKGLLTGVLVVHEDSPVVSPRDLDGKEIAFPTPNALAASLYMRALLKEKERIDFVPRYVMSHSNVYRNVILGKTAAGGGVNKSFDKETPEVRSQLRIIYVTPGLAPHPFSAHPRVPAALRRAVIEAVLKLAGDKVSRHILDEIQMPDPVRADYGRDYRVLEKLNLNRYFVAGEN